MQKIFKFFEIQWKFFLCAFWGHIYIFIDKFINKKFTYILLLYDYYIEIKSKI